MTPKRELAALHLYAAVPAAPRPLLRRPLERPDPHARAPVTAQLVERGVPERPADPASLEFREHIEPHKLSVALAQQSPRRHADDIPVDLADKRRQRPAPSRAPGSVLVDASGEHGVHLAAAEDARIGAVPGSANDAADGGVLPGRARPHDRTSRGVPRGRGTRARWPR